jgi:membrane associated rhomboid family serine protease
MDDCHGDLANRVEPAWYQGRVSTPSQDADRFGTPAFYQSLGRGFVLMCALIPVLFGIEGIDRLTGGQLDRDVGIRPHHLDGLDGVIFAPFLHASFTHLYANSVALIVTGTFVAALGVARFAVVSMFIAVVSGLGVWFLGNPNTLVVGASGVIFGYFGYLFIRGIIERSMWGISVGLLIGLLYGAALQGALPSDHDYISWQAHLFGLVGGLVAAVLFRRRRARRPRPADGSSTLTLPTADLPPAA